MNNTPGPCKDGCVAPLSSFGCGKCVLVNFMCLEEEHALRLREMGLCEGSRAVILQNGQNLILNVNGVRLGLRKDLAAKMFAIELDETPIRETARPEAR